LKATLIRSIYKERYPQEIVLGVIMHYPVFIPQFVTYAGRLNYGHISAVIFGKRRFFLTCYHLFGLGGGLRYPIRPTDLDKEIVRYSFHDPFSDDVVVSGSKALVIPNAKPMNPTSNGVDLAQDVAAFPVPDSYSGAFFSLSEETPVSNEGLYLITHNQHNLGERGTSKVTLLPIEATDEYLIAKFEKRLDVPGFSGAPIVNRRDQFAGMIVGGADDPDTRAQFGLILPGRRIENILREAGLF
jgi:hypothetical protein